MGLLEMVFGGVEWGSDKDTTVSGTVVVEEIVDEDGEFGWSK